MQSVFFVHLFNDFSGSPRVLRDAINAVSANGKKEVHILSSGGEGFLSRLPTFYHRIPYQPHRNKYLQLCCYLGAQCLLFFRLSWLLLKARLRGHDTVVMVNTLLPFAGYLSGKLFSNRTIAYLHETYIRPRLLMRFLTKVVSICANEGLFVSAYVKNALSLSSLEGRVLYNSVGEDFQGCELNTTEKFYKRKVLFVGSLKAYKGIYTFVELATLMPDFSFVAVLNASEDEFASFAEGLKEKGVGNIALYRNPHDIARFFAEAFVVVNLSNPSQCVETFGLTLLEGMSMGTPVIAPPHGGPLEFIDQEVGRLIEPNSLNELESFIQALAQNFDLWQQMSANCLQRAADFSSEKYNSAIVALFNTELK